MDPKYEPKEFYIEGYDYSVRSDNKELTDQEESSDKEESVD